MASAQLGRNAMMNIDEAKESLSFHSGRNENINDSRWARGFLGSLRPYKGFLIEKNFHEIIECIRALADELHQNRCVERDVVNDIMAILHYSRVWGVYEEGMLRGNNLIESEDWKKLEEWIAIISYTFVLVLELGNNEEAFSDYEMYLDNNQ